MDDPKWLRLIIIGLILASLVVGYLLLTGGFSSSKPKKVQSQTNQVNEVLPLVTVQPSPSPASAYTMIADRTQANIQTLPRTGFPVGLFGAISAGVVIAGWSLRKFPH